LSSLTQLRGRIAAVAGVIVLLLVAGVWIALTHASAQQAAGGKRGANRSPHSAQAVASGPLRLVSVTPASHAIGVNGTNPVVIHFSAPLAAGSPMPTLKPTIPGNWQGAGTSTLKFVPAVGFSEFTRVTVQIPGGALGVRSARGGLLVQSVEVKFKTGGYQTARLDQLLAQLGYLPLTWTPASAASVPAATDAAGQLSAAYSAPQGSFSWQAGYPLKLHTFWLGGSASGEIIKGAVMAFEADYGLTMDGIPGPEVWGALLKAVAAGQDNQHGYSYALAREANPETLTVWHDGKIILRSLTNTGIAAAPTTLGTSPVYVRYYYQVMKGTNPDGSKYADPVWYVSYFRNGEAVHYFPRGSYGFPQSLGCVELPWDSAKQVWPYMWYGTLVTVAPGAQTPSTSPTEPTN
jgi:peptidoglycan hydrolase-like protein with peptidoglycan-binding domain